MKEKIYLKIANILRILPNFNGKHRIIKTFKQLLISKNEFRKPRIWIKMKNNFRMLIDLRNETDSGAFSTGLYDSALIKKFTDTFKENWVILDIGSNIGFYSIPFSHSTKLKGTKTFSFEPVKSNYEALVKAKDKNNCSTLFTYNIGLGEKKQELQIFLTEEGSTGNAVLANKDLINERNFSLTEMVSIEALDDFYDENNIERCDFIKIDIEGAEIFFLRGANKTIEKFRPIIYGEFNPYFIQKNSQSMEETWNYFKNLDYCIYQQDGPMGNPLDSFKQLDEYHENMCNLLLVPSEVSNDLINNLIR